MQKRLILIASTILFIASLHAQPYNNAVGIRAGYSSGLNFRHLNDDHQVWEGQFLFNPVGFQFSALFEYQFTPHDKKRVYYYTGAGLFGGNWEEEDCAGIAVSFGAEYVFREVPLTIGLEWKPMVKLYNGFDYVIPDVGMTVRFVIN